MTRTSETIPSFVIDKAENVKAGRWWGSRFLSSSGNPVNPDVTTLAGAAPLWDADKNRVDIEEPKSKLLLADGDG